MCFFSFPRNGLSHHDLLAPPTPPPPPPPHLAAKLPLLLRLGTGLVEALPLQKAPEQARNQRNGDNVVDKSSKRPPCKCRPTSYRSLSGPPGSKSQTSLQKVSKSLPPQKSGKSPEKVSNGHVRDFSSTLFRIFFETFSRLFGRLFFLQIFFLISGPEGSGDSWL